MGTPVLAPGWLRPKWWNSSRRRCRLGKGRRKTERSGSDAVFGRSETSKALRDQEDLGKGKERCDFAANSCGLDPFKVHLARN
jgi:hypothetical protein